MPCTNHSIWAFIIPLPAELRELWTHCFLLFILTRDTKKKRDQTVLNSPPSMLGGCCITVVVSLSGLLQPSTDVETRQG